ncbi:MAG: ferredoxin [Spirochaeta sp. LUC14_002_19_P3]|nr:MAG: ferredoxin [Spirochaeta sp. LUC14_002_19_P3]
MKIKMTINDQSHTLDVHPMMRLLDILRENLTGSKEGCGEGECGACSVFMNGALVNSCLIPVLQCDEAEIFTIEGIKDTAAGKLIAGAFAEAHSAQCGFCTPGMVMAAVNLLRQNPNPSEAEIREGLSGNICRCTGYDMIVDGIQLAARRAKEEAVPW